MTTKGPELAEKPVPEHVVASSTKQARTTWVSVIGAVLTVAIGVYFVFHLGPSTETVALVAVVAVALGFNYTNGFHDAANAIATSVSTRALTPRAALLMAAIMNLLGSFVGIGVAKTIAEILPDLTGLSGLGVVFAALAGAIIWNLITWWFGLPSSSSHALIGGLVGAGIAASTTVGWDKVVEKVVLPMIISPFAGFLLGYLFMVAIMWAFRRAKPAKVSRGFRIAQSLSAAAMAFGHGLQDAQKTMGVIVLALVSTGYQDDLGHVPTWVVLVSAAVLSIGTYAGGWRIMRTLGRKVIELDPPKGFAAEATASSILYIAAMGFHAPISTTHVISSAIMGVGATKRLSAVRWGVAGNILLAWIFTLPAAGLMAALVFLGLKLFGV
ncbi:inorganic phosphate transporter [Actinocorallia sp. A-T 12471]|uniref:inorganic phosphate transporter n=1 Tax=Actinocorallia sp. A-T 12471 TaxID=3089813 RepID=UPI0029CBDA13|nr:inorganic phosphate transporter [Actinocorallia sp. A-T 12471]MDX6738176.1 inorganic phosphate transporter [Actinocorallia sp. A-T 12471]